MIIELSKEDQDMATKVLIAEKHKIISEGLAAIINAESDMTVVGETESGRDAIAAAQQKNPDIVVMGIQLKDLNGVDATRQLLAKVPGVKVLCLSFQDGANYAAATVSAGASGYLFEASGAQGLIKAIRAILAGDFYMSPEIAARASRRHARKVPVNGVPPLFSKLTSREREIFQLLAQGLTSYEIADRLALSRNTVYTHRQNIMQKWGTTNMAKLIKRAIKEGLVSA
jgi:DNA-binding NarL/FixJ family response regulator